MDGLSFDLILAYGKPVFVVLALALGSLAVLAAFVNDPKWPTLALFLLVANFVNPSYGFIGEAPTNVYEWKPWFLPIALLNFYLYAVFLAVLMRNAFAGVHPLKQAGGVWLLLFALLFAGHVLAGLNEGETPWPFLFHNLGVINVVHAGMMMYIAASVLLDRKNLDTFIRIFLVIAVGRALFGLARFALFGGDPQNGYAEQGIKLTYWDLNEGLIASMAAFYFAYRLLIDKTKLPQFWRIAFVLALLIELAVVILSFRRTGLFGLSLASLYFLSLLPWRKRLLYAALGAALVLPPSLSVVAYRAQETLGTRNVDFWQAITQEDDTRSRSLADRGSRFYELRVAMRSVEDNPMLGVGSWNPFKIGPGDAVSLAFHRGNYHFVHSGFVHVLFKTGILGLLLFTGALIAAWRYAGRYRKQLEGRHRALLESYRAGLIFMLPTLAFGTPIVEMRTMLWLGLVLAVPVAIARLHAAQSDSQPVRAPLAAPQPVT